ncbi:polysaccharide deacetylase family protein [Nafulsella turpanensis]|uniref:hypothetical protein n=1 Tax=Nafulsella turpanensis TaxID=1265690 RepID=UPI000346C2C9|nr:hypothetical protein [Nafulsella turpanensis]
MRRDFTLQTYQEFLTTALEQGYKLTSYEDYITNDYSGKKVMILRHDVDDMPHNSLDTARIQYQLGAKGSYYFRMVPQSFHPLIIEKIRDLGHEIGYHYEDMAMNDGDPDKAIKAFEENLEKFREFYPVKTICMHGSPLSKWDNRQIWEHYNYKDYGIIAEPYFDTDFTKLLYITDTGRQWNRTSSSVRDKVDTPFEFSFSNTFELMEALRNDELPDHIMQNIHPQRWNDDLLNWSQELLMQNVKNQVKRIIVKLR